MFVSLNHVVFAHIVDHHLITEKVPGTGGLDSRSVSLRDSQTHQAGSRKGPLFVLLQFHSTKRCVFDDIVVATSFTCL